MISKLLSGRLIMAVLTTLTLCSLVIMALCMYSDKKTDSATFMAIFTVFSGIVREIATAYFNRQDRQKEGDNGK